MAQHKNVVFLLSLIVCVVSITARRCIPGTVSNIFIASNNRLQWSVADNPENCGIRSYIVNILDLEEGTLMQYQTSYLNLTLPGLEVCKTYGFEVHAYTNESVVGPSERIDAKTPQPASMNLTLANANVTLGTDNQLTLRWEPNADIHRCISYYRVIYWDETNNPTDVFVSSNTYHVEQSLIPCMNYSFEVNAIITNPNSEGPIKRLTWNNFERAPSPPKLENITTNNSAANMSWRLPSYAETRCELTDLVITTLGPPKNTSTLRVNITDDAFRPNVKVVLTDLLPNTVYISQVTLENVYGASKVVTVTFQTNDDDDDDDPNDS